MGRKSDVLCKCQHYRSSHVGIYRVLKNGREVFSRLACTDCEHDRYCKRFIDKRTFCGSVEAKSSNHQ